MVGKVGLEPTTAEAPDLQSGEIPVTLYLPILSVFPDCHGFLFSLLHRCHNLRFFCYHYCLCLRKSKSQLRPGADGGIWTHTVLLPTDFESITSAIPSHRRMPNTCPFTHDYSHVSCWHWIETIGAQRRLLSYYLSGAQDGTWTRTFSRIADFKSAASADSATRAYKMSGEIKTLMVVVVCFLFRCVYIAPRPSILIVPHLGCRWRDTC